MYATSETRKRQQIEQFKGRLGEQTPNNFAICPRSGSRLKATRAAILLLAVLVVDNLAAILVRSTPHQLVQLERILAAEISRMRIA